MHTPDHDCRYLRLYVRDASKIEAARLAWDSFLLRERFVDPCAESSSQSQLLKASPARPPKVGRPPVAPALSSVRELLHSKDDATKKKPKVDLLASTSQRNLESFFGAGAK